MFNKESKRESSQTKQSRLISNSAKRDENEQKLPDIQQNIFRNTGMNSLKSTQTRINNTNKTINKAEQAQVSKSIKPPTSMNSIKPISRASQIESSKRVNSYQQLDFNEEMKDQQIVSQKNKPPIKDFLAINKMNANQKKVTTQSTQNQSSRIIDGSMNKVNILSSNEKQYPEELIERVQISKVVKPKEFKFHTNTRVEHRREMNMLKAKENIILDKVNYHIQRIILCLASSSYQDVYKLMKVCKKFYQIITSYYKIWECVLTTLTKQQQVEQFLNYI